MKRFMLLRWLAGAAILAFLLATTDVSGFDDAISEVGPGTWLVVLGLNVFFPLLASLRSHIVLTRLGYNVRLPVLFSSMTLGFVAGSLTPAASGEILRTDALRAKGGIELRDGVTLVVFERLLSFYYMTLTAAVLLAAFVLPPIPAAAAVAAGIALYSLPAFSGPLLRMIPEPSSESAGLLQRLLKSTRSMIGQLEYLSYDKPLLALWTAITMAIFAVAGFQFWVLAEGVGGGMSFFQALFAYCSSQFLGIVSLLPLGLGVADGSLVEVSSRFGMGTQRAVALAVLVRATITLPLILAAFVAYLHLLLQRSVKRPDQEQTEPGPAIRGDEPSPSP